MLSFCRLLGCRSGVADSLLRRASSEAKRLGCRPGPALGLGSRSGPGPERPRGGSPSGARLSLCAPGLRPGESWARAARRKEPSPTARGSLTGPLWDASGGRSRDESARGAQAPLAPQRPRLKRINENRTPPGGQRAPAPRGVASPWRRSPGSRRARTSPPSMKLSKPRSRTGVRAGQWEGGSELRGVPPPGGWRPEQGRVPGTRRWRARASERGTWSTRFPDPQRCWVLSFCRQKEPSWHPVHRARP